MSDSKRLDIQFGSFACSVQGFDDPVQPVQQVLQALQNLLEETPDIANAEISFDAESIERLIGEVSRRADIDEKNVEIIPGLIIVHRGGSESTRTASATAESAGGNEAWSMAFSKSMENDGDSSDENEQPESGDDAKTGYVNIFSPRSHTETDSETGEELRASNEGNAEDDPLAAFAIDTGEPNGGSGTHQNDSSLARLERATAELTDAPASNPFAMAEEYSDEAPAKNIFADPEAEDNDAISTDEDTTIDFFSTIDSADENTSDALAATDNMFASSELVITEPITLLKASDRTTPNDVYENTSDGRDEAFSEGGSERVAALFGGSDNQPAVEEEDEGYTAAGLAKTAEAKSVPDLIVSAAAWMVLIQGQTTFTRKEVVEVFKTIPGDHKNSLEAQIKGFGKAVRDSQLVMVEDGVFGLSRNEVERFQLLL